MSNHPSFPLYVQDFLTGVADFTPEEVGGYIRLLCYAWEKGKIPNNTSKIKQLTGCRGNAVASILTKFFIGDDGFFYQKRLEIERVKKIEYSNRQKAIAESRWGKKDAMALPLDMPEESHKSNSHIHISSLSNDKEILNKDRGETKVSHSLKISFQERATEFKNEIQTFESDYPQKMLDDFFQYWSEKSRTGEKMKCELQKTWETNKRLIKWKSNNKEDLFSQNGHGNGQLPSSKRLPAM